MCGVAGFLGKKIFSPKKDKIKKVLNIMKNRGPDSSGLYERELTKNISLSLLHSRLSVIDPETRSSQPFVDENDDGVFNQYRPATFPDSIHIMGTDNQGRDVLARLIYGFRISITFA